MQRTITVLPKAQKLEQKKQVAAYARVSSGKDAMLHSLSAQVSYYSELIQSHADWLYAGVYSDEAKTGTKEARSGYQHLIADCRAGKIDLVITKSISRFARNTVTLLQTVRELKAYGVDVYFEEQNIHTMSGDGELMMTILASYAQEESRSASDNQKWRIKRNFESGIPWDGTLLGYRLANGRYVIVPKEAETVRQIYSEYLSGYGYQSIANMLNKEGITSRFGGKWNQSSVSRVLSNYTYTGNLLLQKTFRENHISKRKFFNMGELPKYHIEDSHDAIIDIETFTAVQEEKARRAAKFIKKPVPKKTYPFSGLLKCENCGKNYRRKITKSGAVWICGTFNSLGKAACASKQIPEQTLLQVTSDVLGKDELTHEFLSERIWCIMVCKGNILIFCFKDGSEITRIWKDRSRSRCWTDEMKAAARQKTLERSMHDA